MSNVEIYTTETCPNCHAAKDYLNQKQIPYTEHNVTKDAAARKTLMKKGIMSVPLIIINGEEIMGFDEEKISSILSL